MPADTFAARDQAKCPNRAAHNMPDFGYAGPDDEWMAANRQARCEGCGYFVIVTPIDSVTGPTTNEER